MNARTIGKNITSNGQAEVSTLFMDIIVGNSLYEGVLIIQLLYPPRNRLKIPETMELNIITIASTSKNVS